MAAFDQLLEQAGQACEQRRGLERLRSHLLAQLVCLGEHTITGLLSTSGQQFRDWSAAYRFYGRNRVDPAALFTVVRGAVEQQLPQDQPLVVALDDSILRKCGHKIPGTAWRPDPLGAPFQELTGRREPSPSTSDWHPRRLGLVPKLQKANGMPIGRKGNG
jgi:hypothetical protein